MCKMNVKWNVVLYLGQRLNATLHHFYSSLIPLMYF